MKKDNSLENTNCHTTDNEGLSQGWQWSTVGECFSQIINGTTTQQNKEGDGIPVSRIETIQNAKFDLTRIQYIANPSSELIHKFRYQPGDIAFSHINSLEHVGKTALYKGQPEIFLHGMNLLRLRISRSDLSPEFAFYFMQSAFFRDEVRKRVGKAVNQVSINQKNLSSVPFLIAPIAEQQCIVTRLEALLTQVNAAREQLSHVPLVMKRFRQGVLAAACSGRLTEEWREENPYVESGSKFLKRMFESRKSIKKIGKTFQDDSLFNDLPELPNTWTWSTIQQTAERVTVGHVGPMRDEYKTQGIPFLRCQNVRENRFEPEGLVYISTEFHATLKKSALEPKDIVVVRSGNVGTCCVIPDNLIDANCSDLVIVKKPFGFVPRLGAFYINSIAQKWISEGKVGIALSHFNTKSVANLPIPIAPIDEQHEIVRRVGALFARADAVEREVAAATKRTEALTQAVLTKTFAGKL